MTAIICDCEAFEPFNFFFCHIWKHSGPKVSWSRIDECAKFIFIGLLFSHLSASFPTWTPPTIFQYVFVMSFSPISLCLCRGVGRGEGEPNRNRLNRETETPATPQRALPLPTVRESTCDTHQVLHTSSYTRYPAHHLQAGPVDSRSFSCKHIPSTAHFLCLCFTWCVLPFLPLH